MVETTVADIVSPAVTTDDPVRLLGDVVTEIVDETTTLGSIILYQSTDLIGELTASLSILVLLDPLLEELLSLLVTDLDLTIYDILCDGEKALAELLIGEVHTIAILCVVLKEGVGPCRTVTLLIGRVRCLGGRCGVDRGAAGGIGHYLTVTIELRDKLDIGCLTAAGAGAGELEERLRELRVLHALADIDEVSLIGHLLCGVEPQRILILLGVERLHGECLLALLSGADISTVTAAETVEDVDLDAEAHTLKLLTDGRLGYVALGSILHLLLIEDKGTDGSVRTNIGTLITLDTILLMPHRDVDSDTGAHHARSAGLPGTVLESGEDANRQVITLLSVHLLDDGGDEGRVVLVLLLRIIGAVSPLSGHGYLDDVGTGIDSLIVHIDDLLALVSVALDDELLHLLDSEIVGDDVGDLEESGLKDRIGAVAETDLRGDLGRIDDVEVAAVLCEVSLETTGEVLTEILRLPDGIEEE